VPRIVETMHLFFRIGAMQLIKGQRKLCYTCFNLNLFDCFKRNFRNSVRIQKTVSSSIVSHFVLTFVVQSMPIVQTRLGHYITRTAT